MYDILFYKNKAKIKNRYHSHLFSVFRFVIDFLFTVCARNKTIEGCFTNNWRIIKNHAISSGLDSLLWVYTNSNGCIYLHNYPRTPSILVIQESRTLFLFMFIQHSLFVQICCDAILPNDTILLSMRFNQRKLVK